MKPRNIHIKSDSDLDRMLEAYYAGETTADEENAIAAYLKQFDPVPEKYAADVALFKAFAAGQEAMNAVHVPADLERRIAETTYARPRMSRYLYFARWASMAAAIAVLAVVALKLQIHEHPNEQTVIYVASELRRDSVAPEPEVRLADVLQDTLAIVEKPAKAVAVTKSAPKVAEDDNPYVEVTDSATVARILGEVFGKLNSTLAVAGEGIKKTDLALNNIPETINKVLDK